MYIIKYVFPWCLLKIDKFCGALKQGISMLMLFLIAGFSSIAYQYSDQ